MAELVTGYAGAEHITSAQAGRYNAATFGDGKYILDTADQLACSIVDANTLRVATGDALFEGRHVTVQAAETLTISSGAQGMSRYDCVAFHYTKDAGTGIETVTLAVIEGTPTSGTPTWPAIPAGSILDGDDEAYMGLHMVRITGLAIASISRYAELKEGFIDTVGGIQAYINALSGALTVSGTDVTVAGALSAGSLSGDGSGLTSLDGSNVSSGTVAAARVANLPASKITSGTLALARGGTASDNTARAINTVFAGPSSGSAGDASWRKLVAADIPALAASKITSGTLAAARGGTGKTTGLAWTSLGNFTGSSSLTIDLTNYSEVMVVAKFGGKIFSSSLPKAALTTSNQEWWIGGGKDETTTSPANGAGRVLVNVTTTKVTGVAANNGSSSVLGSTTFTVYAR